MSEAQSPTASVSADIKPYAKLSPTSSSGDKPKSDFKTSPGRGGGKGKPWTLSEKIKLFDIAVKKGASCKAFEGQVEGRTGQQCYMTWHNTIEPAIKRSFGASDK